MTQFLPSIIPIVFLILAAVVVSGAIKIVPQGYEYTVERFGKYTRTLTPGMTLLTPFVEAIGRKVNMMEQVLEVPQQEVITKDNVTVQVDAIVFIQVIDAATEPWGVKATRIEIKDLSPPPDITNAMARQMKAERERRAVIIEAEGDKQAAITRAEGAKQSAVLQAEGRKEAASRDAEARERLAQAEANATASVSNAIANGDVNAINYFIAQKYVEAFGKLAESPNQKTVIVPAEMSALVGSLAGVGALVRTALSEQAPTPPAPPPAAPPPPRGVVVPPTTT